MTSRYQQNQDEYTAQAVAEAEAEVVGIAAATTVPTPSAPSAHLDPSAPSAPPLPRGYAQSSQRFDLNEEQAATTAATATDKATCMRS